MKIVKGPGKFSIILEIQKQRGTITGLDNLWRTYILLCEKEKKTLNLQIFTPMIKTIKKLLPTLNTIINTSVLVIFYVYIFDDIKLIYLHMNCETLNWLPALEQVMGLFRDLQTSTWKFFSKIVSNVNLSLPVPIMDEEKKLKLNFYFHTFLWCLKRPS